MSSYEQPLYEVTTRTGSLEICLAFDSFTTEMDRRSQVEQVLDTAEITDFTMTVFRREDTRFIRDYISREDVEPWYKVPNGVRSFVLSATHTIEVE